MEMMLKFVNCYKYNFEGKSGITCNCFDPSTKKLVKVKTDHLIEEEFGNDIKVICIPSGKYSSYHVA